MSTSLPFLPLLSCTYAMTTLLIPTAQARQAARTAILFGCLWQIVVPQLWLAVSLSPPPPAAACRRLPRHARLREGLQQRDSLRLAQKRDHDGGNDVRPNASIVE
eukprot:79707-Pleurochrysis_carterae.AAC.2